MKRKMMLLLTVAFAFSVAGATRAVVNRDKTLTSPTTTINTMSTLDCEGNACMQVQLTWDESKQQYKAQNNSADRWVKVEVANWAAAVSVSIRPGGAEYLPVKSITGAYHANYE